MKLKWIRPEGYFKRTKWELVDTIFLDGVLVPQGFVTDGLSIPFFIRGFLSSTGRGFRAAILHDYLLERKVKMGAMTRQEAAHAFRRQLRDDNVNVVVAQIYYLGVRAWDRIVEVIDK